MRHWMTAGLLALSAVLGAANAFAADGLSLASAVRMPPAEAIGAAIGAVVAVNGAAYLRKRQGGKGDSRREK